MREKKQKCGNFTANAGHLEGLQKDIFHNIAEQARLIMLLC